MDNDQRDSTEDTSATGSQFRQATDALDTLDSTYHRIRQLRQNLMHITDTISPLTHPLPTSYGPGHGALVLTDDQPSTSGAARASGSRIRPQIFTALPPTEAQSGPSPRTLRRIPPRGSQGSTGSRRQATILPPLTPQDAEMDSSAPFLPPDLHGESLQALNRMENTLSRMQGTRSQSLRDGSQTTIGRRVAARAAGAQQQVEADFMPLQQVTANISGSIAELQNRVYSLLNRVMERPLPNSRPIGSSLGDGVSSEERDQLRRLNPVRTNLSHRLSTLSNLPSARNLSTPTSVFSPDRPLLFEEPTSYVEEESSIDGSSRNRRPLDRHYAVRRDGQQSAIPSSTVPPNAMSWMLPSDGSYPAEHHHRPPSASLPQVFDPIRKRIFLSQVQTTLIMSSGSAARPRRKRDYSQRRRLGRSSLRTCHSISISSNGFGTNHHWQNSRTLRTTQPERLSAHGLRQTRRYAGPARTVDITHPRPLYHPSSFLLSRFICLRHSELACRISCSTSQRRARGTREAVTPLLPSP